MKMPGTIRPMMALHIRMMEDPVIRKRMMADSEMQRLMKGMMKTMTAEERAMVGQMMAGPMNGIEASHSHSAAKSGTSTKKSTATKKSATKKATAKKPAKKDSMAGMDHSKMKM
jgi:hypothetical protein